MTSADQKLLRCPICQEDFPTSVGGCPKHSTLVDVPRVEDRIVGKKYRVVREVGKGGMGSVYEARHMHTDKQLAVKLLHRKMSSDLKLVARFRREAMAAGSLNHPNCVHVLDFGEDHDGTFFIVMEFIDGHGLGDELKRNGPLSMNRTAHIGVQILEALDAAHEKGILHRDLKPQNIMLMQKLGRQDFAKVVDFGIAKYVDNNPADQVALTLPGTIFGTPEYMSPEQARGDELDGRSDVYSASVVLWQLLLGRSPFRGKTVSKTLANIFQKTPDSPRKERPLANISPEFEALLLTGMSRSRSARFSSAKAMAQALRKYTKAPHKYPAAPTMPQKGFLPSGDPVPTATAMHASAPSDTVVLPEIDAQQVLKGSKPNVISDLTLPNRRSDNDVTERNVQPDHTIPNADAPTDEIVSERVLPDVLPPNVLPPPIADPTEVVPLRVVEPTDELRALEQGLRKRTRRRRLLVGLLVGMIIALVSLLAWMFISWNAQEPTTPLPTKPKAEAPEESQKIVPRLAYDAAISRSQYAQREGDTKAAQRHLESALSTDKTKADAHFRLAVAAIQNKDLGVAKAHLASAERLDPAYGPKVALWRKLVSAKSGEP